MARDIEKVKLKKDISFLGTVYPCVGGSYTMHGTEKNAILLDIGRHYRLRAEAIGRSIPGGSFVNIDYGMIQLNEEKAMIENRTLYIRPFALGLLIETPNKNLRLSLNNEEYALYPSTGLHSIGNKYSLKQESKKEQSLYHVLNDKIDIVEIMKFHRYRGHLTKKIKDSNCEKVSDMVRLANRKKDDLVYIGSLRGYLEKNYPMLESFFEWKK